MQNMFRTMAAWNFIAVAAQIHSASKVQQMPRPYGYQQGYSDLVLLHGTSLYVMSFVGTFPDSNCYNLFMSIHARIWNCKIDVHS